MRGDATPRNDPCPCGSGRKFKFCCIDKGRRGSEPIAIADSTAIREAYTEGWCVQLDLARQVLRIEIPEVARPIRSDQGELLPLLPIAEGGPVSAAALLLKAKQFDDGLYAAVELAAQKGAGRFPGKVSLLRSLVEALTGSASEALPVILAACHLGWVPVPEALRETARSVADDFLRNEFLSKPLGFYTWTAELRAIFRQDRFLQQPLEQPVADELVRILQAAQGASDAYDACLRLHSRLTNPPPRLPLQEASGQVAFFPASRSHEQVLFDRLFGNRLVPEGFDLMSELIRRVRSGEVDLAPITHSGWYDHQTWSLEPLVVPDKTGEASRLRWGERYRKYLEDLFRGVLALTRETHVKGAGGGYGGAGYRVERLWVHPDLTVEPLPTVYARRAASYRFVRSVVEEAFGSNALHGMHRLTAEGTAPASLAEELDNIEAVLDGAAQTSYRELGMEITPGSDGAIRFFEQWRKDLARDEDVSRDARMMVPVYYDLQRRKMKVWAVLGWRAVPVGVSYDIEPEVVAVEPAPLGERSIRQRQRVSPARQAPTPEVLFTGDSYALAVPVMAEVHVSRLLDRDEFRRHCDRFRTREAILAHLE